MFAAALAKKAHALGLGVYGVTGTNIFLGELPATPYAAAAIFPKTAPAGDFSDIALIGVGVIIRDASTSERPGHVTAQAWIDAFHGLRHVTLDPGGPDEVRVQWIRSETSEPIPLGDDANGRQRWSLRFLAQTTHDTAHTIL